MVNAFKSSGKFPMTTNPKISVRGLYKIFGPAPREKLNFVRDGISKEELLEKHGHVLALDNIDLDINAKEVLVLVGLSGSGKSTLIRHFNRLIEPTEGTIKFNDRDILLFDDEELQSLRRKKIAMVFQGFALLPHRTVLDNVKFALNIQGASEIEAEQRSQNWIKRVGLTGFEDHFPAQLSGGMKQRVGLARALAVNTETILMDEAFSALDALTKTEMQDILLGLQEELRKTIVFITHDLEEALKLGDKIAILHDGRLVQHGDPQSIVLKPANDDVAKFVEGIDKGRVIKLRSIMTSLDGHAPEFHLPEDMLIGDALMKMCMEYQKSAGVVDPKGKASGYIDLERIVTAISNPMMKRIKSRE